MAAAPWEPTLEKAMAKLRDVLEELHVIWEDVGYLEETRLRYCEQAYKHIEDLLDDMVTESKQRRQTMLNNTKQLMDEISTLAKELAMDVVTTGYEKLSLRELEQALRTDMQELQCRKDQRIAHLKELLAKEKSICKSLGSQPIGMDRQLPTEVELNSFKLYLEKQEAEKNRLEAIFKDMRRSIVKMMDDLGVAPFLDFEHLVYKDPDNFIYNSRNMTKLKELKDQLKNQVDETKQHADEMKQELVALWKYLDEPEHVCESFLNSYVGYSTATINALTAELKRCKEKRRQNIASYVQQMRNELVKLWDMCKCSEHERNLFTPFHSNTYTEDLLTLHELEVERMQKFYETNKEIFALLEKRESLWSKMLELLQRADNPDRFYNRGGQLLKEEKERKTIQKKLPKIEEQLKCLIQAYEKTNGENFTINGMPVEELLKESWENLNEEKQIIKKARKEAKNRSVKAVTPNVSRKSPRAQMSSSKKKLLFSASPNTSAKRKNRSITVYASKIRRSGKLPRILITPTSEEQKKCEEKENSVSHSSAATDTTYNQFKEHLESKAELRSSILPENVLGNANKSKIKTPIRTPAKPLRKNLPTRLTPTTPKTSHLQSGRRTPRSPRVVSTPKLATATTPLPIIF